MTTNKILDASEQFLKKEKEEDLEFISVPAILNINQDKILKIADRGSLEEITLFENKDVIGKAKDNIKSLLNFLNENSDDFDLSSTNLEPTIITMKILEDIAMDQEVMQYNLIDNITNKQIISLLFYLFEKGTWEINSWFVRRDRCYLVILFKNFTYELFDKQITEDLEEFNEYGTMKPRLKKENRHKIVKEFDLELLNKFNINDDVENLFVTTIYTDKIKMDKEKNNLNSDDEDDELDPEILLAFENAMKTFQHDSNYIPDFSHLI